MPGEVKHFGTVRCRIHFWWMWCRSCQNRSRFAKVIAKSVLLPHFMFHSVVTCITAISHDEYLQQIKMQT